MIRVVIYHEPKIFITNDHRSSKRKREDVCSIDYAPAVSSLKRTKQLVQDLVLCNNFDFFCTFTFDPKKVPHRENFNHCWLKMQSWLHHQKVRATDCREDFQYLIIPERHKNGGWHFHALISHYTGSLRDSGHQTKYGRTIYNITSFRSGFTTAVKIDDKQGVSNYVTKYITKDFVKDFDKRRFYCSRGLKRPKKTINSKIFKETLPLFRKQLWTDQEKTMYEITPPYEGGWGGDKKNLLTPKKSVLESK